jgi:hypothetical protein
VTPPLHLTCHAQHRSHSLASDPISHPIPPPICPTAAPHRPTGALHLSSKASIKSSQWCFNRHPPFHSLTQCSQTTTGQTRSTLVGRRFVHASSPQTPSQSPTSSSQVD